MSALEKLHTLQGIGNLTNKFSIVLALKGIRQAGALYVTYKQEYRGDVKVENTLSVPVLMEILHQLGIPYHTQIAIFDQEEKAPIQYCVHFFYGTKKDRLQQIFLSSSPEESSERSWLYGAPNSLIEARRNKTLLTDELEPREYRDSPLYFLNCFGGHALSRDHWREEMALLHKWVCQTYDIAPWLWGQAVKSLKESQIRSNC